MRLTAVVFFGSTLFYVFAMLLWNWYTHQVRGPETSISCTMSFIGHRWPIVPILMVTFVALLVGHWFWPITTPIPEDTRLPGKPVRMELP